MHIRLQSIHVYSFYLLLLFSNLFKTRSGKDVEKTPQKNRRLFFTPHLLAETILPNRIINILYGENKCTLNVIAESHHHDSLS